MRHTNHHYHNYQHHHHYHLHYWQLQQEKMLLNILGELIKQKMGFIFFLYKIWKMYEKSINSLNKWIAREKKWRKVLLNWQANLLHFGLCNYYANFHPCITVGIAINYFTPFQIFRICSMIRVDGLISTLPKSELRASLWYSILPVSTPPGGSRAGACWSSAAWWPSRATKFWRQSFSIAVAKLPGYTLRYQVMLIRYGNRDSPSLYIRTTNGRRSLPYLQAEVSHTPPAPPPPYP